MLVRPTSDFRLDRWELEIVCNLVATVALRFRLRRIYSRASLYLAPSRPVLSACLRSAFALEEAGINSY